MAQMGQIDPLPTAGDNLAPDGAPARAPEMVTRVTRSSLTNLGDAAFRKIAEKLDDPRGFGWRNGSTAAKNAHKRIRVFLCRG